MATTVPWDCRSQIEVVGMEQNKINLIERLMTIDSDGNAKAFETIHIVGIGGSGKTTLARLVFNDDRIAQHFNPRIWVSATQGFSYPEIKAQLLKSAPEANSKYISLPNLLDGKRYLLVFDDVWQDNDLKWVWSNLQSFIMEFGNKGSKVLVTTRWKNVASFVSTAPSHHTTGLNEDDSLKLLVKFAFPQGHACRYPNLLEIGRHIVQKCNGNPLAIATLGFFLKDRLYEDYWEYVRLTDIWRLPWKGFDIWTSLRKSYASLSPPSKACFAYCALFPKGHRFEKKIMMQLWSAEHFFAENSLDTADEVIEELLSGSFFYNEEKNANGDITTFKVPDIFHDLTQLIADNMCSEKDIEEGYTYKGSKRISFEGCSTAATKFWTTTPNAHLVQTILRHGSYSRYLPKNYLHSFKALGVLDLHDCGIRYVPEYIGELIMLTYIDLSINPNITELPETICELPHLQTLKLLGCENLIHLPIGILGMAKLICLETTSETNTPPWISNSRSLQLLPNFVLGQGISKNRLSDLGPLNKLKGELHIFNLEYATQEEAEEALLENKRLQELELAWRKRVAPKLILGDETAQKVDYSLLDALWPNKNLKKLSIRGYAGLQFPKWMMTCQVFLPSLVELSLINCVNCVTLPPITKLFSLKARTLKNLISLEYVQSESNHTLNHESFVFPSLQYLFLNRLPRLIGWSTKDPRLLVRSLEKGRDSTPFPCLTKLTIKHCPGLSKLYINQGLQQVKFKASRVELLQSVSSFCHQQATLISLEINQCDDMEFLLDSRLVNLSSLKSLSIVHCQKLRSLSGWLHRLPVLEILKIQWCPEVKLFENENSDASLGKLHSLTLSGIPSLINLLEGLQNAKDLQDLSIEYCKNLKCLSLEAFPIIEHLEISCCCVLFQTYPRVEKFPLYYLLRS